MKLKTVMKKLNKKYGLVAYKAKDLVIDYERDERILKAITIIGMSISTMLIITSIILMIKEI